MKIDRLTLEKETEKLALQARRYHDNVSLITLLHRVLEINNSLGKIFTIERELIHLNSGNKREVDIVIAFEGVNTLFELKSSVRNEEKDIKDAVQQILNRDSDFKHGVETLKVKDLVILAHKDDISKLYLTYQEMIEKGEIKKPQRNLVFLSWYRGFDTGEVESWYISFFEGEVNNNPLLAHIKTNGLKSSIQQLCIHQATKKFVFTNKRPIMPYLCAMIKAEISNLISAELMQPSIKQTLRFMPVDEFCEIFKKNRGNEFAQPRKEWIAEALEFFHNNLRYIRIPQDINEPMEIIIKPFKTRRKGINDEYSFFSKCISKIELIKKQREERKQIKLIEKLKGPKQKSLSEF